MQYTLLIYETEAQLAERNDPARAPAYWGAYTDYSRALVEAGIMRGGAGLQPPTAATTIRLHAGKRQVQDGPFADTKERLGGFYIIEVEDLDKALEWAARSPSTNGGSVEVRPTLPPPTLD